VDEQVDILDESGEPTGRVAWKSEAHRTGLWHRAFHCWVCTPSGEYLLVQRRASGKDFWPDRLDVSAAGHLRVGERPPDGLRELEEELGLSAGPEDLIPLGTRRMVFEGNGRFERELQEVYLLPDATHPADLRLQAEEVASIVRLRPEDVERVFAGEPATAEEWRAGRAEEMPVRLEDFIPDEDRYTLLVARAVRELAAGRTPARIF
jgi:isopentenyldiphosphate isomerase